MNNSIEKIFETPLGQVICGLTTDSTYVEKIGVKEYENGSSILYKIGGFKVEFIEFKIRQPLYNGETVKDSNGWIWRIEKIKESIDNLKLSCVLSNYSDNVDFDTASGEHLIAIEASNKEWTLHLGTEDGEILHSRAECNDWFPERLKNKVDILQSITHMLKDGFETEIPKLKIGEQIHIQYLLAYDQTNSESVKTWLAVDEFKRKLENWVGIR